MVVLINHRASANLLERISLDVAGRKSVRKIVRFAATHRRHQLRGEHLTIDRAPRYRVIQIAKEFFAEAIFAAVVETQVAAHSRPVLRHEANEAAKVVPVRVAEDQTVDLRRIDIE